MPHNPLSSEMQLMGAVPDFMYLYIERGILEHMAGSIAYKQLVDKKRLFQQIFASGSGSALHGALSQYIMNIKAQKLQITQLKALWDSAWMSPCRLNEANLWNCMHGIGHGIILWHTMQNAHSRVLDEPCVVPHIIFGSLHIDRGDLLSSSKLCAWFQHDLANYCVSGVFHVFFRNSLDFALELQRQSDKVAYVEQTLCSLLPEFANTVCSAQTVNAASGKYILASLKARGLRHVVPVEQMMSENGTDNREC